MATFSKEKTELLQSNRLSALQKLRLYFWLLPFAMDDTTKGGPTLFWELFTVIPCAPKDFKRCYLNTIGSEITNEGSLELEKAILRFLG